MGRKPNALKLLPKLPMKDNNVGIDGTPTSRSPKVPMFFSTIVYQKRRTCKQKDNNVQAEKIKDNNVGIDGTPTSPSTRYQTMYLDFQKKIEDLTNENQLLAGKLEIALGKVEVIDGLTKENQQLSRKLENALGKVEALESQITCLKELIEILINGLTKSAETPGCAASGTKRKRDDQES